MLQWPPRSGSRSDAKMLGESNRGQQNQSTTPPVVTRAAVCRSPMRPWSAIAGYLSMCVCSFASEPSARDQAESGRSLHRLAAGADLELAVDGECLALHGALRDVEALSHLPVREVGRQEPQDAELRLRER